MINVVNVAKSGGNYTSVQDALNNITATANERYLIRVAPGVYTSTVDLESYVDIEGSSEEITILRGLGGNTFTITDGTVRASGVITSEVRACRSNYRRCHLL